jgi:hypothetical protein
MGSKKIYHSALKGFDEYRKHSCQYFEHDGFYGICNDLETGKPYPDAVYKAQFIYCELPFPRGYDTFNKRVGKSEGLGWKAMVTNARNMAIDLDIPYYFMGSKAFAPLFPIEYQIPMKFKVHNTNDIIFSNRDSWADDNEELIDKLYKQYDIGLDMACGYGELGRIALTHGKKAILMDINPYCIGYIKHELLKVSENG